MLQILTRRASSPLPPAHPTSSFFALSVSLIPQVRRPASYQRELPAKQEAGRDHPRHGRR